MCIYITAYSLKFIYNPKSTLEMLWQSFVNTPRGAKYLSCQLSVAAEVELGAVLLFSFISYTTNGVLFAIYSVLCFFALLCSLLVTLLFRMVPKHKDEELPSVTHCKKAVFYAENICDKLRLGMSYTVLLAMSSTLMNQKYLVNKVSLNKHTQNRIMYWLVDKCHDQGFTGTYLCIFPSSNGSAFTATLQNLTMADNKNWP